MLSGVLSRRVRGPGFSGFLGFSRHACDPAPSPPTASGESRSLLFVRCFSALPWRPLRPYIRVFLFEVMPELQQPKWGKTAEERVAEARVIEGRLERIYATRGYDIVRIAPGPVEERAARVLDVIARTRA